MRITRHFFAAAGPSSASAEYSGVALPDRQVCAPGPSCDELESDDGRELWSAWIDIGGEG
jgi:hypothetical protein